MKPAPYADLSVAYADTSASGLGFSLTAPLQEPLAQADGEVAGLPVSLRLLGASHQVLVGQHPQRHGQLLETVACLPEVTSDLPSSFQESGYYFNARTETMDDDGLTAAVADIVAEVDDHHRRGLPALLGRFPGSPLALTAIVAGPGTGDPGSEVLITWRTWHTYPQTGEVVVTSSSLWRQGVAHNRTQA
ncbi:hypothetical protein GOAMR_76_00230 [Gordonia amarae NBRC 15530]|uniref:DUF2617 family protein n=1 Tax=Gordonia amarae NBRC 15530 TaxID=1075090 RepID=G7GWH8_9ACTN|nr:hypothetical protein GOAMR_76_00230 [Gordonia amarae NBRC 15530]